MNMKATKYLRYILPVFMLAAATACQEELYEPGEPDLAECQGLFFPQDQAAHYELSPKGKMELTFTVQRDNADLEAEVPYELVSSVEGMFELEDDFLYFDEDQKKATFKVYLAGDFELGEKYSCTIKVTDPAYVSKYALSSSELTFSVSVVDWVKVTAADGSDKAVWRDDFFTSLSVMVGADPAKPYLEKEVQVYQRSDRKGYFRVDGIYTADYIANIAEGTSSAADGLADYCPATSIFIDATNPDKVFVNTQFAFFNPYNFTDGVLGAEVYMCSDVQEVFISGYTNQYGKFKDGVITFPAKSLVIYMPVGIAVYGNQSGKTRLVLPGYKGYDYGISVSTSASVDGKMPVEFVLDPDVAEVKYKVFEGHLSDVEMVSKLEEVKAGRDVVSIKSAGTYEFSTDKSGFYTLIACSFDAAGNYQEHDVVKFGYDTASDPRAIDINLGLIVSDKHAASGLTSENSMEFYVYGSDIVDAKVAIYKSIHYEDFRANIENEFQYYMPSLDYLQLESVNGEGYSGVIGGLTPGTEYKLVVYADNGYHTGYFTTTATTAGVFNLMEAEYTAYDLPERLQPAEDDHEPYLGDWQVWSVNPHTAKVWNRTLAATATFKDKADVMYDKNNQVTRDPEKAEYTLDYLSLEGMHPTLGKMGLEDAIDFEFYKGFVYTMMTMMSPMTYGGKTVYPTNAYLYFYDGMLYPYLENGAMIGGFLTEEKDVIAFVGNPSTAVGQSGATYVAMQLCRFADQSYSGSAPLFTEDAHAYPLLVRPDSKYVNAGEAASVALPAEYSRVSAELHKQRSNYVETDRGYIMSVIDDVLRSPYNYLGNAIHMPVDIDIRPEETSTGIEYLDRVLK